MNTLPQIAKSTVLLHQWQIIQTVKYPVRDKIFRQIFLH